MNATWMIHYLIETKSYFNELINSIKFRLCDEIVTVLFKYDFDVLSRFLDFNISEMFILREKHKFVLENFVIWRHDRTVIVNFNHSSSCIFW